MADRIVIHPNERVEPLDERNVILQTADGYRFGSDAVALYKFAARYVKRGRRIADLCSGCGVIGLLLAIDTGAEVVGAEIDGEMCDMSNRSCALNGMDGVKFINADVNALPNCEFGKGSFDAVVCNPPYYRRNNKASAVAPQANCEISVCFDDIARVARELLSVGGAFFTVHATTRLDDVISSCVRYGLTPKQMEMNANGKTFLLRCVKGGKQSMDVVVKEF